MTSQDVDNRISSFFDNESRRMKDRHEEEGIPSSMRVIVDQTAERNPNIVLDVGSGPGSLLLELLKRGVPRVVGMDLSEDMNTIAQERLDAEGFDESSKLLQGSFLDLDLDDRPDAITFHRILCCHPDREQLLRKSADYDPQTISISIPRDWKFMRFFVAIYGVITKLTKSFRPYIHTQNSIDQQMKQLGYTIKARDKEFWWVTTVFEKDTEL